MLRVGIIGCGYWGPNLIRNFVMNDGTEAVQVADLRSERLAAVNKVFPAVKTTTDANELFANPDIDLVAIATPVTSHLPLAKAALEAGKHVLLEKPLTCTSAQSEELCALADAKGLHLFVDHTFLFTGAVKKLKQLIDSDELGEILYIDSMRMNLGLYQQDVSVIWDIAPHDLSIMQYLLGKNPTAVSAITAARASAKPEIYDLAYLSLKYGPVLAHVSLSWLSPVKVRQMIVAGSKKMAIFDDLQNVSKVQIYDCGATPVVSESSEIVQVQWEYRRGDMHAPVLDGTEALRAEIDYMIKCIADGQRDPINSGRRGLEIVRTLETADRSATQGGAFVAV
jgi:predicted dehydrogenase